MSSEVPVSRLREIAGPNGSGKSSYFNILKTIVDTGVWINADELNMQLTSNGYVDLGFLDFHPTLKEWQAFLNLKETKVFIDLFKLQKDAADINIGEFIISAGSKGIDNNSIAALLADFLRNCLIKRNRKLTTETVFSHPSKIQLVKDAAKRQYKTYLYFICTESPFLNVERVKSRLLKGGHDVLSEKIVSRYHKALLLLSEVIPLFDRVYLFDNSLYEHRLVASIVKGKVEKYYLKAIPAWVIKVLNSI